MKGRGKLGGGGKVVFREFIALFFKVRVPQRL